MQDPHFQSASPPDPQDGAVRAIVDAIDDVIYAKDAAGRLVYANPAALALIGKPASHVIGRTDAEFLSDPAAAEAVMRNDRAVMDSGQPVAVEERVPLPDGTERLWFSRKVPWRDEGGRVIGLLGISRDVTERMASDRELGRMRALMQSTLENFPTAILFKDRDGRFIEVNRVVQQMFGRPREEILGLAPHDFLPPELADRIQRDHEQVIRTAAPLVVEQTRVIAGRTSEFLDTMFPLTDEQGKVYGVGFISHDITERKRVEAELAAANEQLLQASHEKDQFLATVAHELRNPLAPIRTAAELIRVRHPADERIRKAQEIIQRQADHLTRIVDDLLDVSRVSFGTVQLQRELQDLAALALAAADSLQADFDAAGVKLEVHVASYPRVNGDATRLAQCIGNLLGNALKFTPAGGLVRLRVEREGDAAALEVHDTGVGIQPENLERIFDLFIQEHRSGLQGNTGLGLGLALTRKLAQLHGGSVKGFSEGPGRGSTFILRLPLAESAADHAQPLHGLELRAVSKAPKVLVVDDNADAADTLAEMLQLSGYRSVTALTGEQALDVANAEQPEVVILDIGLPGMDGYEVCRRLRGVPALGRALMIALTGWGQDSDKARAQQAGFDRHFTKPADLGKLLSVIDTSLRERATA